MSSQVVTQSSHLPRRRKSGGGALAIIVALLFIVGPIVAPSHMIPALSKVILMGFGVLLLLVGSILVSVTRLYHKAAADEAFVRTGMGGARAIVDGGAIVIPVVHEIIAVSLKTMKLTVERTGTDALITGDNLRTDVRAEFFIKVDKTEESVLSAATSLGEKAVDPTFVEATVFEKLVNALRTVAATRSLSDLHTKRDEFAQDVQKIVSVDLKHNGITLESVTISKLDQTPTDALRPDDNVFDAKGAQRIAEITNEAKVQRTNFELVAQREIAEKTTKTKQFVAAQEALQATAEANKGQEIRIAQANADREAAVFEVQQKQLSGVAANQSEQAIQVAEVQKIQSVQVANAEKEKAVETATIEKERIIELSARAKQIAVANAETDLAKAHATRLTAEAEAEQKRQEVQTVTVTSTAERNKRQTIIDAQAAMEQKKLEQNLQTDVAAYATTVGADAEKKAAENKADARLKNAEADRKAKILEAEGNQAVQMVPVNVQREQVSVERQKLQNQQEFQEIAKELQVDLARIEASKEVQVAFAGALGTAFAQAKMTVWGTPEQVMKMSDMFLKGQGLAAGLSGLLSTFSQKDGEMGSVSQTLQTIAGVVEKMTGKKIDPSKIIEAVTVGDAAETSSNTKQ